jgi:hypothetical protein
VIHFVSGHLDLTQSEFGRHYAPRIKEILEHASDAEQTGFVVGDARGADEMTQNMLAAYLFVHPGRTGFISVAVYHMLDKPRNNKGGFPTQGGFKTDELRDCAMTLVSDADLVWVRPGRERSGTAKNITRRVNLQAKVTGPDGDVGQRALVAIRKLMESLAGPMTRQKASEVQGALDALEAMSALMVPEARPVHEEVVRGFRQRFEVLMRASGWAREA